MSSNYSILIVEDSVSFIELLIDTLSDNYQLKVAKTGQQAIELCDESIDAVLLDVWLPDVDGYHVCQQLKERMPELPVIFVTGADSDSDKLLGYEAGGNDYLSKPYSQVELKQKLEMNISIQHQVDGLKAEIDEARSVAMNALDNIGALGVVMNFLRDSFNCNDATALGKLMLGCIRSFGLQGVIEFSEQAGPVKLSTECQIFPIEHSVLEKVRLSEQAIISFNQRCAFVYPGSTLLIKNMPINDKVRNGELLDHLAILTEGASSRIAAITIRDQMTSQQEKLRVHLNRVEVELEQFHDKHVLINKQTTELMDNLAAKIERAFSDLGMSEEQESHMLNLLNKTENDMSVLQADSLEQDEELVEIIIGLREAVVVSKSEEAPESDCG